MKRAALDRVLRRLDRGEPLAALSALSSSEWRTLELAISQRRAERPLSALRRQYSEQAVCAPAPADAKLLHLLDGLALDCLPTEFDLVELSPVVPLGTAHQLAGTPQHNVLTATRGTEVSGDATLGLTLELAARRAGGDVHLAASARMVRMQPLIAAAHTAHFRLWVLASGGRAQADEAAELHMLRTHAGFYVAWLTAARSRGFRIGQLTLRLSDFEAIRLLCQQSGEQLSDHYALAQRRLEARGVDLPRVFWKKKQAAWHGMPTGLPERFRQRWQRLGSWVCAPLVESHPELEIQLDLTRLRQATYYTSLGFHLDVDVAGSTLALCDGGMVDWSQRLLQNRKERQLTSGAGLELLARLGAPTQP